MSEKPRLEHRLRAASHEALVQMLLLLAGHLEADAPLRPPGFLERFGKEAMLERLERAEHVALLRAAALRRDAAEAAWRQQENTTARIEAYRALLTAEAEWERLRGLL